MSIGGKIIAFIRDNEISTTEVADALGKMGVLPNLAPQSFNLHKVGRVRTIFTCEGSNYGVHDQARLIEKDEIAVIFAHNCDDLAIIGDLIARYILLHRGAAAIVVNGRIRDASRIRRECYPVWATGVSPLGCVNEDLGLFPGNREAEIKHHYDGGIAVCDDGGVTVIPVDCVDEEMFERLERLALQEDIWSYCLNTLKWDTKKIVCERDYLNNKELLPPLYEESLNQLRARFTKRDNG